MERCPVVIEPMAYYYNHLLLLVVVIAVSISNMEVMMVVDAQQAYVSNHQLDCYNQAFNSSTLGYLCNGLRPSCPSYLTFRSTPLYNSPALIANLLGASQSSAPLIASLNNISSDTAPVPTDSLLIVPVPCSCSHSRRYYQHNATYLLKSSNETYFTVANNTYQGITTCQALMDQNPFGDRDLLVDMNLSIPLRCACPTRNQTSSGIKYLLSYMVTWGDSLPAIAQLFGADLQALRDANQLSSSSIIFPFTPILVPLTAEPTSINRTPSATATPDPPPSPQIPITPAAASKNKRKPTAFVYVSVGVGTAVLLLVAVSAFLFWRNRRPAVSASLPQTKTVQVQEPSVAAATATYAGTSWSLSSHDAQHAVESLTLYTFEELETATKCFSEANRIKGAVYKGSFKGDAAAVKIMKGDVSGGEINLLKMLNHSNITRLSGFCVDRGNTYLVYEYAENGSLSDWLRAGLGFYKGKSAASQPLSWKQRVQIAFQVADALNYLHNYTTPPHIHKNLSTSNILLDANLRAKIANFGLARTLGNQVEGGNGALQLTRHVVGTQGYMPPEYIENGVITPKMDVFALGVVLLELLSGKEAAAAAADDDKYAGHQLLSAVIKQVLEGDNVRDELRAFLDPSLENDYPLDLAFSMAQLAKSCVAHDLNARPSTSQAFLTLSKILSSSLDWDPSDPSDLQNSTSSSIAER